jgi:AGZA family xanthine/uracil permease-like MFS transporter
VKHRIERYFEFERLRTNWRTEILAGVTTFVTMAYIIFVNPSILRDAGMPFAAVVGATCFSAALGSVMMGAFARYPIALAPGMGLNAYFAYTVVNGLGVPWQVALGAVFLSGVAFVVLTLVGIRQLIVSAIPKELYAAVASGIGLFIALIGFRSSGLIVPSAATMVALGNLRDPKVLLAVTGLLGTAALLARGVRGAMLMGVFGTTAIAVATGLSPWQPQVFSVSEIGATAFAMDVRGAMALGVLDVVFVFLFVDLLDNVGTLVAVGKKARLFDEASTIPRLNRILLTDATATMAGALAGTSTVVSYVESAAGAVAGGRSGVTAIVTGLLFAVAFFVAPLVGAIPAAATAPALILVGSMMVSHVAEIDWENLMVAIPAFLTIVAIPLTFSIANGIAFGFIAYTVLHVLRGDLRRVNWLMYVLTALFVARFVYLGGE